VAKNALPLVVGVGVALLFLRDRGTGRPSCPESLAGVWHEPEGDNLPITHAFYEDVEAFMKEALTADMGLEREVAVGMAKRALLPGCEFSEMTSMHEDVHSAIGVVYDNVRDDL
jgi:hypothetical protein